MATDVNTVFRNHMQARCYYRGYWPRKTYTQERQLYLQVLSGRPDLRGHAGGINRVLWTTDREVSLGPSNRDALVMPMPTL